MRDINLYIYCVSLIFAEAQQIGIAKITFRIGLPAAFVVLLRVIQGYAGDSVKEIRELREEQSR